MFSSLLESWASLCLSLERGSVNENTSNCGAGMVMEFGYMHSGEDNVSRLQAVGLVEESGACVEVCFLKGKSNTLS